MGWFFGWGCSPCCEDGGCPYEVFKKPSGGSGGGGFPDLTGATQVAGSWSITGGNVGTSDTNARLIYTGANLSATSGYVTCTPWNVTVGDVLLLIFGWQDANNYFYVQGVCAATFPSAIFVTTLWKVVGGAATQLGEADQDGASGTLQACWNEETLVLGGNQTSVYALGETPDGAVGLGTGNTNATGISFRSLVASPRSYDYPECPACPICDDVCTDAFPDEIEVTLPAMLPSLIGGGSLCEMCDDWSEATYVLPRHDGTITLGCDPADITLGNGRCFYYLDTEEECDIEYGYGRTVRLHLAVDIIAGGLLTIYVLWEGLDDDRHTIGYAFWSEGVVPAVIPTEYPCYDVDEVETVLIPVNGIIWCAAIFDPDPINPFPPCDLDGTPTANLGP